MNIGHDLIDGHAVGPEPLLGSSPEPRQRIGFVVVERFDTGDAAAAVDRDAQERAAAALGLGRSPAVDPPAAAGRHFVDLFDVETDQLAAR